MYSTPSSSMDLRRASWMSRRRWEWAEREMPEVLEGDMRDCHDAREARPEGSMMASSTAIVPFAILEVLFANV